MLGLKCFHRHIASRRFQRRGECFQAPSLQAVIEVLENRCLLSATAVDLPDLQADSDDGELQSISLQSNSTLSKSGQLAKVNTSLASLFNNWETSSGPSEFLANDSLL